MSDDVEPSLASVVAELTILRAEMESRIAAEVARQLKAERDGSGMAQTATDNPLVDGDGGSLGASSVQEAVKHELAALTTGVGAHFIH